MAGRIIGAVIGACAATAAPGPAITYASEGVPEVLDVSRRSTALTLIEVSPFFGAITGDKLHAFLHTGSHVDFRLSPNVALGGSFGWAKIAFDPDSAFGRVAFDDNLYALQSVFYLHMPSAFLTGGAVAETDLFGAFGAGMLRINESNRANGSIGGGMKIYFASPSWLGIRVEIKSFLSTLETANGTEFASDSAVMVGPILRIPPLIHPGH